MKLVYVSGPYSPRAFQTIDDNIEIARRIAIQLWEAGHAVICPHLNTAHMEIDCSCTWEDYIKGDRLMIERCDAVVMVPGWEQSKGSVIEKVHAEAYNIPVYIYPALPEAEP